MAHRLPCLDQCRLQGASNQHATDFLAVGRGSVNIRIRIKFFGDDSAQLAEKRLVDAASVQERFTLFHPLGFAAHAEHNDAGIL